MKNPIKEPLPESEVERRCHECSGEGSIECKTCYGEATHECDCGHEHDCCECGGYGDWPCEACFGSGCEIRGPREVTALLLEDVPAEVHAALVRVSPHLDAGGLPRWEAALRRRELVELVCTVECLTTDYETQEALSRVGFFLRRRPETWPTDGRGHYVQMVRDSGIVPVTTQRAAGGAR